MSTVNPYASSTKETSSPEKVSTSYENIKGYDYRFFQSKKSNDLKHEYNLGPSILDNKITLYGTEQQGSFLNKYLKKFFPQMKFGVDKYDYALDMHFKYVENGKFMSHLYAADLRKKIKQADGNVQKALDIEPLYPKFIRQQSAYQQFYNHYDLHGIKRGKYVTTSQRRALYYHLVHDLININTWDGWEAYEKCTSFVNKTYDHREQPVCIHHLKTVNNAKYQIASKLQQKCNKQVEKLQFKLFEGEELWKPALKELTQCVANQPIEQQIQ